MFLRRLVPTSKVLVNLLATTVRSIATNRPSMAEIASGKHLKDILSELEAFAPLALAESWDNVGLLVDPMVSTPIRNILLTNDLTEDVVKEAVKLNVGFILTYHPNIFQGLKSVSNRTWKERIVVECIKNSIAVFSPHTSWDAVTGGVNDWLAEPFAPLASSNPIKADSFNPDFGSGRLLTLANSLTVNEVIENVKNHIGIPHLRLALARNKSRNSSVSTVALCAGSGASLLKGVDADLYLTGEMLHHDVLEAAQNGIHVILCNHSDSERGFLKKFKVLMERAFENKVQIFVSEVDSDPLKTV